MGFWNDRRPHTGCLCDRGDLWGDLLASEAGDPEPGCSRFRPGEDKPLLAARLGELGETPEVEGLR